MNKICWAQGCKQDAYGPTNYCLLHIDYDELELAGTSDAPVPHTHHFDTVIEWLTEPVEDHDKYTTQHPHLYTRRATKLLCSTCLEEKEL